MTVPTTPTPAPLLYVGGPDRTPTLNRNDPRVCGSTIGGRLGRGCCTRESGHHGHHALGDGVHIVAMWLGHDPDREPTSPGPERLAAGLADILALHSPTELITGDVTCEECGACAPCPTSRAAAGALQAVAR